MKTEIPVILFPGFFQNDMFWDLMPGDRSLAEYLNKSGMDVWVVSPRGTHGSDGRRSKATMDNFAAVEYPGNHKIRRAQHMEETFVRRAQSRRNNCHHVVDGKREGRAGTSAS